MLFQVPMMLSIEMFRGENGFKSSRMRRLKEQLELDQVDLDSSRKNEQPISNAESAVRNSELDGMEVSYNVLSNFPGLNHPTESSSDSSVTFRIRLNL